MCHAECTDRIMVSEQRLQETGMIWTKTIYSIDISNMFNFISGYNISISELYVFNIR